MEETWETTMHCSGLGDQHLLSLTEFHRCRCGFRLGGSPCSRRGTKACFWFLALALPAKCWQRFVSRSKSQLCSLMLQIWVKWRQFFSDLTVRGVLAVSGWWESRKLIRVPARSRGIYYAKAKVEGSARIEEVDWSWRDSSGAVKHWKGMCDGPSSGQSPLQWTYAPLAALRVTGQMPQLSWIICHPKNNEKSLDWKLLISFRDTWAVPEAMINLIKDLKPTCFQETVSRQKSLKAECRILLVHLRGGLWF